MVFELKDNVLEVTTKTESGETKEYFEIPKEPTNWQMMEIECFIADLLEHAKKPGEVVLSSLLAMLNTAKTKEEQKRSFAKLAEAFHKDGGFIGALFNGSADLIRFWGKGGNVRLVAILFLKRGEKSIRDEAIFKAREDMFYEAPAAMLKEGLMSFFGEKLASFMTTLSRLRTIVLTTSDEQEADSPTSERVSSIDLSTQLQGEEQLTESQHST